ncbi:MAG: YebC/PmpR family DNA-binding transcriptional regulator [Candidatus Stahlbacteria bacterium]|nr:MAG: YebC/PmpR family DNA-binding transcriptional regulator [Candidatus Stahlbacteria bacterium]
MSGHSKWHRIKRQKQSEDQKRGKIFSKLSRKVTGAARNGRDPERNSDLRQAISDAKANNMPKDNIERAILRGTGELPGTEFFETTYEGYGPGGVALFIDCVTDNKKRTTSEIRHILESNGGKMGAEGCVSYLFKKIGSIIIPKGDIPEMAIYNAAIEAGALDIKEEDDFYEVITEPSNLHKVTELLSKRDIQIEESELNYIPTIEKNLEGKEARKLLRLLSLLEDLDDTQKVYSNFNIPDSIIEEMEA